MVRRTISGMRAESVPSSCAGFGLGTRSSLSLADSSFLSWSEEPDLELVSDDSLCSAGVSIQRRRVVCESGDRPFLGLFSGLDSTSGEWEWAPGESGRLLKVLGSKGGG